MPSKYCRLGVTIGHLCHFCLPCTRHTKMRCTAQEMLSTPFWTCSNAADGQCTHGHILLQGEVHAAVASCHELVCVTQLTSNGSCASQVGVPEPHASHVLMQTRDHQCVVAKVLQRAEQAVLLEGSTPLQQPMSKLFVCQRQMVHNTSTCTTELASCTSCEHCANMRAATFELSQLEKIVECKQLVVLLALMYERS